MSKNIVIIGGGIVGLSSAYFLHKSGHQVTILDKAGISAGASFVNAGYITPSHIIPLASPGMITKGLKWMFNSSSPFYMKPRWDPEFFKWAWYFHRSSTKEKVEKAIPVIKDINVLSRDLFEEFQTSGELGDFQLENKGLLMLYQSRKFGDHELEVAEKARFLGLEVHDLDHAALQKLEPHVKIDALGAVHYLCDRHTTPTEFMPKLVAYLESVGVKIKRHEEVQEIQAKHGSIESITTDSHIYTPDEVVLAAGSWSGILAKKLSIKIPMQAGKGYRINIPRPTGITLPAILMETKVACTPMNGFTRFAGTMEFSGINTFIRKERVEAIAQSAQRYYTELEITKEEKAEAKSGLRPVTPDGLPYIGRSKACDNLVFATGHAMMGWSLGPATGKLISEVINGAPTSMDISPFSPDRKFN